MANLAEELLKSVADLTAETKSLRILVTKLEAKLDGNPLEFLAKVAREIYGNAKAKSVALAWAHSAKEPSVTKWAKGRNNAQIQAWFKRQVA